MPYQLHSHVRVKEGKYKGQIGEIMKVSKNGWHKISLNKGGEISLRTGKFGLINEPVKSKSVSEKKWKEYQKKKSGATRNRRLRKKRIQRGKPTKTLRRRRRRSKKSKIFKSRPKSLRRPNLPSRPKSYRRPNLLKMIEQC